jgi:hypothetical protein
MKRSKSRPDSRVLSPQSTQANGTTPADQSDWANEKRARCMADLMWIRDQFNQGALEEFEGEFIAVYEKQVIAHSPKYEQARAKAARKFPHLPVERFAVEYIDKLDWNRVIFGWRLSLMG